VLHALVDEIRGALPDTGPEAGTVVRLLLTPATEHRADRVLLESAASAYPSATVEVRYVDADMLGIELALQVSDAWHDHPDAALAIVTDAGRFASVARYYEGRHGRLAPWLLHLHERPPVGRGNPGGPGRVGPPTVARRLRPQLDQPAEPRVWNRWDRSAWALRRLAGRIDPTPVRHALRPDPGVRGRDPWAEADLRGGVRLDEVERVDSLVADLWRLEWGGPFDRDRAEAEAVRRGVGEAEAQAAVDALLVAQLVRWHDRDRLEVPPSWREGLLLPMRRVVLRLAQQADLSWSLAKLVQQHRRRFIGPAAATTADPRRHRRVEHESRVDSWRWVRWALLQHLGAVEEQPDWRARGSRWVLIDSEFAADTVETARQLQRRLADPVAAGHFEAELEREGVVVRANRWLRCLRDVGLVQRRAGRWERAQGVELHPPRGY
jgi:hypothetical protein